ncbi:hypothetical protein Q7C_2199 [Methylophaga frappieri]|uniref:Uncharacterized protein n=1 Tax=Methylophaga frappieri (strain ATCC BAA-2434 / DSM 25690 / JAM7) TaxID=754477 RepID=I1YK92_METFJ|nr:hypothetical protein [Methylophaga frappieri]AFJ03335.1 hypothetical protein Q7C_2199 [Methylophaga frappieri]
MLRYSETALIFAKPDASDGANSVLVAYWQAEGMLAEQYRTVLQNRL